MIAQSFPTTAPSSWSDPAALPFALTCLLTFIGGLATIYVILNGRMNRQSKRMDEVDNRVFQTALASPPPPAVVVTPPPKGPTE